MSNASIHNPNVPLECQEHSFFSAEGQLNPRSVICSALLRSYAFFQTCWSFEEKTFVKQSMISEWEKCV